MGAMATDQETPAERHAAGIATLKRAAAAVSARPIPGSESREAWEQSRREVRRQFLASLGLDPLPKRTPLRVQRRGILEQPGYRIEKLVFQSLPGLYVTSNLYVPTAPSGRLPTILYVCGHSPHPRGAKSDYQDRAVWFAQQGYVCFVLDTLEFGEVPGIHHGLHDLNLWHWLSLGYSPAAVEVWNGIRALDYLETRPEVDARRIGITGISGGGAMSWFIPAADDRVAVAAPVCGTFTYGSQAEHWRAFGQCDCIYYMNPYQLDLPAVGALIAPRPLLICSGRRDADFPPDGYHAVYERLRGVYRLYRDHPEAEARVREVDEDAGHSDTLLFRQQTRAWMNRWLRGDTRPVPLDPGPLPHTTSEALACLDRPPLDAANYRIADTLIPTARLRVPGNRDTWDARRSALKTQLRELCFRWFPSTPAPFRTQTGRASGAWAGRYSDYRDFRFQTEEGVFIRAQVLRCRARTPEPPLLLYVKRREESFYPVDLDELLPVLGHADVVLLNPRFSEQAVTAAELADLERSAVWSGRTVGGMQVWDVLRAVAWLLEDQGFRPPALTLFARGEMGVVGAYAALFEERIGRLVLRDPSASHWQGPGILNALRVTDVPEVFGALAPREVVCLRQIPPGFDLTRRLFRLVGVPDHFRAAASLPEALAPRTR